MGYTQGSFMVNEKLHTEVDEPEEKEKKKPKEKEKPPIDLPPEKPEWKPDAKFKETQNFIQLNTKLSNCWICEGWIEMEFEVDIVELFQR